MDIILPSVTLLLAARLATICRTVCAVCLAIGVRCRVMMGSVVGF